MNFYYVYILLSIKDNKFYTEYAKNLKVRFDEHCRGQVISTKDRRPLELIYYRACLDEKDAIRRENYLKTYHGKKFIKKRVKSYLTG